MQAVTKHGDFSGLAGDYSKYRPAYSETVLTALLSMIEKPIAALDFVDVGAGTGIWTRMVAARQPHSAIAVEPNDDMRQHGQADNAGLPIKWQVGSGTNTELADQSADFLTMASSFHWVDFNEGTKEFHRVLRPGGRFCALWNPRFIEANPLLVEIENKLYELAPHIKRVSSGRSGITEQLTDLLNASPLFDDVIYIEGRHAVRQTPEHYIGVWRSVNDIRFQAGEEAFSKFMAYVEDRIKGLDYVETTYLTRAWSARRV